MLTGGLGQVLRHQVTTHAEDLGRVRDEHADRIRSGSLADLPQAFAITSASVADVMNQRSEEIQAAMAAARQTFESKVADKRANELLQTASPFGFNVWSLGTRFDHVHRNVKPNINIQAASEPEAKAIFIALDGLFYGLAQGILNEDESDRHVRIHDLFGYVASGRVAAQAMRIAYDPVILANVQSAAGVKGHDWLEAAPIEGTSGKRATRAIGLVRDSLILSQETELTRGSGAVSVRQRAEIWSAGSNFRSKRKIEEYLRKVAIPASQDEA